MQLLREITEQDLFEGSHSSSKDQSYRVRKAARAIVYDYEGRIAILKVGNHGYHKLPGGGLEGEEGIHTALRREILEEVGAEVQILEEIGLIIEYRDQHNLLQISYCYRAEVVGEAGEPDFTEEEKAAGFVVRWVPIHEALQLLETDRPSDYSGTFIKERDRFFLQAAVRSEG